MVSSTLLGHCDILCPVGTVTLDSPHPGFDPALPEEYDPSGGRLVLETLLIISLLLLRPNSFKPLFYPYLISLLKVMQLLIVSLFRLM